MHKRGNSWRTDFWHDGVRYQKTWKKVPQTVAREREARFKAAIFSGEYHREEKRILFEDLAEKYLEYAKANKRPQSARRNGSSLVMLAPHFDGKMVADVTAYDLEKYKITRKKQGSAPSTINRDIDCIRNMMGKAVEWGYLSKNPLQPVKKLKEDNERMFILTDKQEERFLVACDGRNQKRKYLKDLVTVAMYTGMRLKEIFNLKKGRVHLDMKYLDVVDTKTHEPRKVPLNQTAIDAIKRQLKNNPSDYVFCNAAGKQLPVLTNAYWNTVADTGLVKHDGEKKERFRFHDLRHTFGSRLGMNGYDLKTIMEIMGIKSPRVAMRYMHPAPEHKLDAVNSLDAVPPKSAPINFEDKKEAKKTMT